MNFLQVQFSHNALERIKTQAGDSTPRKRWSNYYYLCSNSDKPTFASIKRFAFMQHITIKNGWYIQKKDFFSFLFLSTLCIHFVSFILLLWSIVPFHSFSIYSIICLLTALGAYPLNQAQQSVPSDLSSAFNPEDISIQVSYDEQSNNGFTDGTLFTPQRRCPLRLVFVST